MLGALGIMCANGGYGMHAAFRRVYRAYCWVTLTLGHFNAYSRPSSFFLFYRLCSVQPLPRGFHQLSPLSLRNFTNFRPQTSKGAFAKGRYEVL